MLLIGGEDSPDDLPRRMWLQAAALGFTEEDRLAAMDRLVALPGAALPLQLLATNKAGLMRSPFLLNLLKRLEGEEPLSLIILDPLSRFAPPDSEADPHAATRLIEALEALCALPGSPAVIAAHHVRKQPTALPGAAKAALSAGDVRGSSALVDGARWVAGLEGRALPSGAPGLHRLVGLARLSVLKSNVGSHPDPFLLGRLGTGGLCGLLPSELEGVRLAGEQAEQEQVRTRVRKGLVRKEIEEEEKGKGRGAWAPPK